MTRNSCSSRSPSTEARLLVALLLGLAAQAASAQSLTSTTPLSFGSFTAGTGGSITLTSGGGRSKTGGVILVNQGALATAAQFTMTGTANATFAITLPADGTVTLDNGANHMAINVFVSNPSLTGTLSGGGTQVISVGATLTVGNSQVAGNYTGAFNVTVDYN
ncbi:MAG TPA: DUF4402 domain-containing protein [Burkholderiaceae bacterium]|jgi:hypothetical protein